MLKIDTKVGLIKMSQCEELSTLRKIHWKLDKNVNYTIVEIKNNYFSCRKAGETIVKMFSENFTNAVKINLRNNDLDSKSVGKMIALMKKCELLEELDLSHNLFNRKDKTRLTKAARKYSVKLSL